jgi:polyphosphate kinase
VTLRDQLEAMIEREIRHKAEGRGGHLIFKMNALEDPRFIRALYAASQAE